MSDPLSYLRTDALVEDDEIRIYESEYDSNPAVVTFHDGDAERPAGWQWAWSEDMPGEGQAFSVSALVRAVGPFHAQAVLDLTAEHVARIQAEDPHRTGLAQVRAELTEAHGAYRDLIRAASERHMDATRALVELEQERLARERGERPDPDAGLGL